MDAAAKRIASLRKLLAHARERLGLGFGFVLWDGSTVPEDLASDALAISIADEGAVAALMRRPNTDTLANLWATARLDLRNGTLFDLMRQRPRVRTKQIVRSLDKWLALDTARRFAFVARGGPWPLENIKTDRPSRHEIVEDKRNVHYHYDASNAFYALWLDENMVYTCAYFHDWNEDIDTAQRNKMDMVCRKLRLKPGETMIDLGCGWGGLLIYAAQNYGISGYGVTLAEEQARYAQERIARLGLADRIRVDCADYASAKGEYDKVAAICILEHVGSDNFADFYGTVHRLLKPGGLFLNQSIARPAKRDDKTFKRKNRDYAMLTKYIFPGGEVDYIGRTAANLERFGFEVHDVEGWREHYQRTCRIWHDRLLANRAAAESEVGTVTTRLWLAYLAGCSLGFERNAVLVFQTLASRHPRGPSGVPPTRAYMYQ